MRLDTGFVHAVDLWKGRAHHDGGLHTPAEGVNTLSITGTKNEKEGVLGKEGGFDKGFLFGEIESAWLNGGARLGFEGLKVSADVFGVLIGTEEDRNGNAGTVRNTGGDRAGGGFVMEVTILEPGIDSGINCDAISVFAPGCESLDDLQGFGIESAADVFRKGREG